MPIRREMKMLGENPPVPGPVTVIEEVGSGGTGVVVMVVCPLTNETMLAPTTVS
jgi:hypothetical protein